jgi:hypothetical protein
LQWYNIDIKYVKIHASKSYIGINTLYDFACIIDNVRAGIDD